MRKRMADRRTSGLLHGGLVELDSARDFRGRQKQSPSHPQVAPCRDSRCGELRDRPVRGAGARRRTSPRAQYLPHRRTGNAGLGQHGRELFGARAAGRGDARAGDRPGRGIAPPGFSPGRVRHRPVRLAGLRDRRCECDPAQGSGDGAADLHLPWCPRAERAYRLFRAIGRWAAEGGGNRCGIDRSRRRRLVRGPDREGQGLPHCWHRGRSGEDPALPRGIPLRRRHRLQGRRAGTGARRNLSGRH
jgi:hypothetical protein